MRRTSWRRRLHQIAEKQRPKHYAMIVHVERMFMIWKAATAFVHSSELITPDAITAFAITRTDITGGLQRIKRKPWSFGEIEWFGRESIEEAWLQLLPPRMMTLVQRDLEFIVKAFQDGSVPGITWMR